MVSRSQAQGQWHSDYYSEAARGYRAPTHGSEVVGSDPVEAGGREGRKGVRRKGGSRGGERDKMDERKGREGRERREGREQREGKVR